GGPTTGAAARPGPRGAGVRAAAVATAGLAVAAGPLWYRVEAPPAVSGSATLALVQPGVVDDAGARLDRGLALTDRLDPDRYDLVVWGESSVGFDLDARPDLLARLQAEAARLGSDLL